MDVTLFIPNGQGEDRSIPVRIDLGVLESFYSDEKIDENSVWIPSLEEEGKGFYSTDIDKVFLKYDSIVIVKNKK